MSLPTTALANVRVIDSWTSRPFSELGDTATRNYYLRCHCLESSYNALVLGTANLASAATAGVVATRYVDAAARWVGDVDFQSSDGGYITFIRRFARIPESRDELGSMVVDMPKVYDPSTNGTLFLGGPKVMRVEYEYRYASDPSTFTLSDRFTVISPGGLEVNYTRASGGSLGATTPESITTGAVVEATIVTRLYGDIYQAVTAKLA